MMKKLLKVTYILVKNYLIDCLGKKVKSVKENTELRIDGKKMAKTLKNGPAQIAELRSENQTTDCPTHQSQHIQNSATFHMK